MISSNFFFSWGNFRCSIKHFFLLGLILFPVVFSIGNGALAEQKSLLLLILISACVVNT